MVNGGNWRDTVFIRVSRCLGAVALFFVTSNAAALTEPAASSAADRSTTDVQDDDSSGLYRGAQGTEIHMYRPVDSAQWVMGVVEPEGAAYTLILEGRPDALRPSGMDYSSADSGNPMEIVARGDRLYARGVADGQTLECVRDERGIRSAVEEKHAAGDAPTSAEQETGMMLEELAGRWDRIRAIRVAVDTNNAALQFTSGGSTNVRSFSRQRGFGTEEQKLMENKLAAYVAGVEHTDTFLARERKLEETP